MAISRADSHVTAIARSLVDGNRNEEKSENDQETEMVLWIMLIARGEIL